ncbi:TMEM175 family protein [Algoriphagus halophytocola]|uniref:TMEM175 family protein n=1 Tax=Algoriphagus halophytocola TaxID=2991499 RepID=A0ABY6MFA5_9BACT|nr:MULTISPECIES: TMEM175 family protein [unclassified Algoriphagus]UZD21610.1 TMEM175 family protein [Algoriphagus sp. TR-M5]WBL42822.1 TMEM175 family protein [Algoriphagus sp. TR-M9]
MRNQLFKSSYKDPNITYRGLSPSRLDNLTDAVFGIAVTLLIFNVSSPDSLQDLIVFTKTLPAFLISIGFLIVIWQEHVRFSEIYTLRGSWLIFLNSLFIALIIFYVYPLRFLTLFLTNLIFGAELSLQISPIEIPDLMIYYGGVAFALYFVVFWFYYFALNNRESLGLSNYEVFHTKYQRLRIVIMFTVPLISILLVWLIRSYSITWASFLGGMVYGLYTPAIMLWVKSYKKAAKSIN